MRIASILATGNPKAVRNHKILLGSQNARTSSLACGRWTALVFFSFLIAVFSTKNCFGNEKAEILDMLKEHSHWAEHVSFRVHCDSIRATTGNRNTSEGVVRLDGEMHFQQIMKRKIIEPGWEFSGQQISEQYVYGMPGNTKSFVEYVANGKEAKTGYIHIFKNGKEKRNIWSSYKEVGAPLYLRLDQVSLFESLPELLSKADITLSNEDMRGINCVTVSGETPYGNIKMWLSPKAGYAPLRYVVKKIPGKHLAPDGGGQFIPGALKEDGENIPATCVTYIMDDIQLEKTGKYYIPIKGKLTSTPEFANGKISHVLQTDIELSDIDLNPDFEAMGAFKLEGVPDETLVTLFDKEGQGISDFVYRDGQVVPRINQKALAAIEDTVRVAKGQALETGKQSTLHLEVREKSAQALSLEKGGFFWGKIILSILLLGVLIVLVPGGYFLLRKRERMPKEQQGEVS